MDPYIGEMKMVGFSFAPRGWAICDGQLLDKSTYVALYDLIGTTYGGDGVTNFAVPDLRGRAAAGVSAAIPLGGVGGAETHTLTAAELPGHWHNPVMNTASGNQRGPAGASWAYDSAGVNPPYRLGAPNATMNAASVVAAGGDQPHGNMQPFLTVNWIICLEGIYPTTN